MVSLMLSSSLVQAEDNDSTDDSDKNNSGRPIWNGELRENRMEFRKEVKENREEKLEDRKEFREEMRTNRQAFMDKLKTDREAWKTELRTKREEFRALSKEKREEFRGKVREMVGQRFEMVIKKLEGVEVRVLEIIAKLDADGKDTTEAENSLDLFGDKLDEAKAKVAQITNLLPDDGEEVTPEVFEQIKLLAREAKDLLKEAHGYLKDTIKEIRELKGEDDNSEDDDN